MVELRQLELDASGYVAPREVVGVADVEQPVLFVGRLEFGDVDRPAEPSARRRSM